MTGIEMVKSARKDVVQLQSALTAVEAGLETVEVAAEAPPTAQPSRLCPQPSFSGHSRCISPSMIVLLVPSRFWTCMWRSDLLGWNMPIRLGLVYFSSALLPSVK